MSKTFTVASAGITNRAFPFWKGERAEEIVRIRQTARLAGKAEKPTKTRRTRGTRITPPEKRLRRLRRALTRRKTDAGRARVAAEIKKLEASLR